MASKNVEALNFARVTDDPSLKAGVRLHAPSLPQEERGGERRPFRLTLPFSAISDRLPCPPFQ